MVPTRSLLKEPANSPTTVLHCTLEIEELTRYLNPGQIPVVVVDQTPFTIAKRGQILCALGKNAYRKAPMDMPRQLAQQ
jgi:hypothetical protein